MGFLKDILAGGQPEAPSKAYLRAAPVGPTTGKPMDRKGTLYMAALNQIADMPVASTEAFGRPVADTFELAPAVAVVRELLAADRSLHAWVARNGVVLFDVVLENMPSSWDENLDVAMASVGLEAGPSIAA